jgi:hypothetical protein
MGSSCQVRKILEPLGRLSDEKREMLMGVILQLVSGLSK